MAELHHPITETGENILFRSPALIVTDKRLLFDTKTVTLSAIASIKVESPDYRDHTRRRPLLSAYLPGIGIVLAGLGFAIGGAYAGQGIPVVMVIFALMGLVVAAVGFAILGKSRPGWVWRRKRKRYSIKIRTVDGEKTRITGLRLPEAQQIANVISAAATQV